MRTPRRTTTAGSPPPPPRGRRAHAGPPADERADIGDLLSGPSPQALTAAGRWSVRPRTVRAKIVSLLMVPIVSLLALWAYATVSTAQDIARLRQSQRVDSTVRAPVDAAVAALQAERAEAVRYATDPATVSPSDYKDLSRITDRAVAKLRLGDHNTVADGAGLPTGVAGRLADFVADTERLRSLRTGVLDRRTRWQEAYGEYTRTIATAFGADGALTGVAATGMRSESRVLLEFSRAGEALAQEDAVLGGARLAGTLDAERLRLFTGAVDTRRTLTDAAAPDLGGPERVAWNDLMEGSAYDDVRSLEDKVLAARPGAKALDAAPEATWSIAHERVSDGMRTVEADAGRDAGDAADPLGHALFTPAGAAVLFGLGAVIASLIISVRIGRDLVVELVALRDSALDIARRKLPSAMSRLRAGEAVDVDDEAPPGRPSDDETGQVAQALNTVHRAALHAAVERAELAGGISGVFVNLARRSQVLVHRQLNLLDAMERRSEDPDELSDLFRLDHLTTRMRRHAESLIILSGAAPGRAWRRPVSLTNVVRAAVSEIEDYARVEVRQLPETAVAGAAVADLTHLLAELVENAAQFSPPHTRVRITGEPVANGYAIEVEDRGLGMGKERIAEANLRIERSEALDLYDSDRLGLFVVSRLSARHEVKVHLQPSPYGGTTAVVLLPTALLHDGPAERSPREAEEDGTPDREYTRVPDVPERDAVQALDRRPALVLPRPRAVAEGSGGPSVTPPSVDGSRATPPPPDGARVMPPAGYGPRVVPPPEDGPRVVPPPADVPRETAPRGAVPLRLQPAQGDSPGTDGLPRRVRQANLAPQLREQRVEEPTDHRASPVDDERTPEVVRTRMTAYRAGWTRGGGRPPGVGAPPGPRAGSDSSEGDPT
ncbi:sensor histidine kinase [Streptomyces aureus]|uniref:sensor histidine kinase n=1 Tax=Streptomyces aureus TaxID=193461 RepID=UPI00055C1FC7|nr:nitrate- and nitrite sensing domain-containing protein [Streptomyces aureus]